MKKQRNLFLAIATIVVAAFTLVAFTANTNATTTSSDDSEIVMTKGMKITKCGDEKAEKKCGEGKEKEADKSCDTKEEKKCGEGKCGDEKKTEKKAEESTEKAAEKPAK